MRLITSKGPAACLRMQLTSLSQKMKRLTIPDIAKGIAILLVVLTHTGEGIYNAGIGSPTPLWKEFHNFCYTFMVPVFFLYAGFFAHRSSKNLSERVYGLFSNLIYPYLLWSLLQIILMIITKAGNRVPLWSDLPHALLVGWMQFWFLHALIIISIYDLLARRAMLSSYIRIIIVTVISSLSILDFQFPRSFSAVAASLIYFEFGTIIVPLLLSFSRRINIVYVFIVSVVCTMTFYLSGAGYEDPLRMIGAFSGIVLCVSLSAIISRVPIINSFLGLIGMFSLQIYVLHVIFAAGTRVLIANFGINSFWAHFLLGSFLGVFGSLLVGLIDNRYKLFFFRAPKWIEITSRWTQRTSARESS